MPIADAMADGLSEEEGSSKKKCHAAFARPAHGYGILTFHSFLHKDIPHERFLQICIFSCNNKYRVLCVSPIVILRALIIENNAKRFDLFSVRRRTRQLVLVEGTGSKYSANRRRTDMLVQIPQNYEESPYLQLLGIKRSHSICSRLTVSLYSDSAQIRLNLSTQTYTAVSDFAQVSSFSILGDWCSLRTKAY